MNFNREITIEPVFYESITFEIKLKRERSGGMHSAALWKQTN